MCASYIVVLPIGLLPTVNLPGAARVVEQEGSPWWHNPVWFRGQGACQRTGVTHIRVDDGWLHWVVTWLVGWFEWERLKIEIEWKT
jgi:hypothetical protein